MDDDTLDTAPLTDDEREHLTRTWEWLDNLIAAVFLVMVCAFFAEAFFGQFIPGALQ